MVHLLEHLMFATETRQNGEFERQIMLHGGRDSNGFTSHFYTYFTFTFPKEKLSVAADLDADRMANAAITPSLIDREKAVVLAERSKRSQSATEEQVNHLFSWVYETTGYSIIGQEESITGSSVADLQMLYQTYYVPNNALIVVVGDVDPGAVMDTILSRYGSFKQGGTEELGSTVKAGFAPVRSETRRSKNTHLPLLLKAWYIPDASHRDHRALSIAGRILNDGMNAQLRTRLAEPAKASDYSAAAVDMRGFGLFAYYAELAKDASFAEAERTVDEILSDLAFGRIAQEQLKVAKNYALRDAYDRITHPLRLARWLGRSFAHTDDVLLYAKSLNQTQSVSATDVQQAVREYISTEEPNILRLMPMEEEGLDVAVTLLISAVSAGVTLAGVLYLVRRLRIGSIQDPS
jgi:zinc protease